ncbi:TIGR02444 family protein [Marinobacter sp. R17]|uniref:TIGR02444 family protein n=1 Tax=Marinobacter sp. R17 TaxID=2484250 RepID=UPI0016807CBE|nr:TIGR02444 family protein [Marinobacter sp. R17]
MEPPSDLTLDNPLWRTALQLWSNKEVAQASLALQAQGCSVSRLLTATWLAIEGQTWDGEEPDSIRQWREHCTERLRTLRQSLNKTFPTKALRESIQGAELQAEQIELAWIYTLRLQDRHNMSSNSVYNEGLLIRNLRAAAPEGDHSTILEAGMNRLIEALRDAIPAAHATTTQGSQSR